METNGHKKVYQLSDQAFCSWCGKMWDMNDPHPPECSDEPATVEVKRRSGKAGRGRGLSFSPMKYQPWPTPVKAHLVGYHGYALVVWALTSESAEGFLGRFGIRADYISDLQIANRGGDHPIPRGDFSPVAIHAAQQTTRLQVVTPLQLVRLIRTGELK